MNCPPMKTRQRTGKGLFQQPMSDLRNRFKRKFRDLFHRSTLPSKRERPEDVLAPDDTENAAHDVGTLGETVADEPQWIKRYKEAVKDLEGMYLQYRKAHPDMPQIGEQGLRMLCEDSTQIDWQDIFVSEQHGIGEIPTRLLDNEQKKDTTKTGKIGKWFERTRPFFKCLLQVLKFVSTMATNLTIIGTVAQGFIIIFELMDAASTMAKTFYAQLTAVPDQIERLALINVDPSHVSDYFRRKSWDLLTAIIELIATGLEHFSYGTLRKAINVLGDDPRDGRIKTFQDAIESYNRAVNDETNRTQIGIPMWAAALTALEMYRDFKEEQNVKKAEQFVEWLNPSCNAAEMELKKHERDRKKHGGALSWLLQEEKLTAWKAAEGCGTERTLWINGLPGVGKSTIISFLISHFESEPVGSDSVVLYFFFDSNKEKLKYVSNAIRTLAYRLSQKFPDVKNSLEKLQKTQFDINLSSTLELMEELLQAPMGCIKEPTDIYILIDALDKCQDQSELSEFIELALRLPNSRLLVTSTKDLSLPCLSDAPQRSLSLENAEDITHYVSRELKKSKDLAMNFNKVEIEDPVSYMRERSEGIFLWVVLLLPMVAASQIVEGIKDALDSIPSDMEGLYRKILGRIKSQRSIDLVKNVFLWLAGSQRDLTAAELHGAIKLAGHTPTKRFSDGFLQKDTGALIQFSSSSEDSTMRFIHSTFRDFLVNPLYSHQNPFHLSTIHPRLTERCLRHLSEYSTPIAFSKYAGRYWMEHLRQVDPTCDEAWSVAQEVCKFFNWSDRDYRDSQEGSNGVYNWIKMEYDEYTWESGIGFIHRIVNLIYAFLQRVQPPTQSKGDEQPESDKRFQTVLKPERGQIYSSIGKIVANVWINGESKGWRGRMSPAGHLALHCQRVALESGPDFNWVEWYKRIHYDSDFGEQVSVDEIFELAKIGGYDPASAKISAVSHGNLAEALYSFQHPEKAIEYLETAHSKEPKVLQYLIGLGEIYESLAQNESRAQDGAPELNESLRQHAKALENYDKARKLDPERATVASLRYWTLKASMLENTETPDIGEIIKTYLLAIEQDPEHSGMKWGQYYHKLGYTYCLCEDYEAARDVFHTAIARDAGGISSYQCEVARTYAEEENWSKTVDTYVEGLSSLPSDIHHIRYDWRRLAESYHDEQDCPRAVELLEAAMEKDPDGAGIYLEALAREYLCQQSWDAAITRYEALLKQDPLLPDVQESELDKKKHLSVLALLYLEKGDLENARKCCTETQDACMIVEICIRQNRLTTDALEFVLKIYEGRYVSPDEIAKILHDLGWSCERAGETLLSQNFYGAALQYYQVACGEEQTGSKKLAKYRWQLALTLERMGQQDAAAEQLEKATTEFLEADSETNDYFEEMKADLRRIRGDGQVEPSWFERKDNARRTILRSLCSVPGQLSYFAGLNMEHLAAWAVEHENTVERELEDISKPLRRWR